MKKFTPKQIKAISGLTINLDELDNKPRRLFEALRKFTEAFIEGKDKDDTEHKNETLDSIDEFERIYYRYLNIPELMRDIGQSSKDTARELTSREKTGYMGKEGFFYYRDGVVEACNEMVKKVVTNLVDLD